MKRIGITLTVLLVLAAACLGSPPPAPTRTPTATGFPPTPTLTPMPTATATSTPVPTWPILFHGAPCEETESECLVPHDKPIAYYSIESDGSGLEQVTEFPSGLLPPEGSPRPYGEPRFSPDGRLLAYAASEGLYVADTAGGAGGYIFRPEDVPGVNPVGPVCWMPDGESLKFVLRRWEEGRWHNEFYRIGVHGEEPRLLFTLSDLDSFVWTGVCSPDGREMAFAINPYGHKETGIYLVDLESGKWRRILTQYIGRFATCADGCRAAGADGGAARERQNHLCGRPLPFARAGLCAVARRPVVLLCRQLGWQRARERAGDSLPHCAAGGRSSRGVRGAGGAIAGWGTPDLC